MYDDRRTFPENDSARTATGIVPFRETLLRHGVNLTRLRATTLQVNVGLQCNQACRHCHLEAGPERPELMTGKTMGEVASLAAGHRFPVIDITGGAPELNPRLGQLLDHLAPLTGKLILRSNLTAITESGHEALLSLCEKHRLTIMASFPSLNEAQAESQRGSTVFGKSLTILRRLNSLGYGREDSGLELNLVANPTGAFLPPKQHQLEKRYREVLRGKWGVSFNRLFSLANVPLGRFRHWLITSGNLTGYMRKLEESFNPCAVKGLMCRSLVSVAWDGYLYDCDFNQAAGLPLGGHRTHVSELTGPPGPGTGIALSDHCYTCTAGAGFT